MEQVLDFYKKPYNKHFPVVCMDESPKQLIKETRKPVAMKPGQEARVDFEYERCGVVNIFLASEPLKGKRYVEVTERKPIISQIKLSVIPVLNVLQISQTIFEYDDARF